MKYFLELISKHIDFHFALALIAILGTAGSLFLQFNEANTEFEILNASMYSVVKNQGNDLRENMSINQELDELEKSLDGLKF
ncbi:MAG: hypothetical protein AAB941_01685 [Patescibacteria group bacterium]